MVITADRIAETFKDHVSPQGTLRVRFLIDGPNLDAYIRQNPRYADSLRKLVESCNGSFMVEGSRMNMTAEVAVIPDRAIPLARVGHAINTAWLRQASAIAPSSAAPTCGMSRAAIPQLKFMEADSFIRAQAAMSAQGCVQIAVSGDSDVLCLDPETHGSLILMLQSGLDMRAFAPSHIWKTRSEVYRYFFQGNESFPSWDLSGRPIPVGFADDPADETVAETMAELVRAVPSERVADAVTAFELGRLYKFSNLTEEALSGRQLQYLIAFLKGYASLIKDEDLIESRLRELLDPPKVGDWVTRKVLHYHIPVALWPTHARLIAEKLETNLNENIQGFSMEEMTSILETAYGQAGSAFYTKGRNVVLLESLNLTGLEGIAVTVGEKRIYVPYKDTLIIQRSFAPSGAPEVALLGSDLAFALMTGASPVRMLEEAYVPRSGKYDAYWILPQQDARRALAAELVDMDLLNISTLIRSVGENSKDFIQEMDQEQAELLIGTLKTVVFNDLPSVLRPLYARMNTEAVALVVRREALLPHIRTGLNPRVRLS